MIIMNESNRQEVKEIFIEAAYHINLGKTPKSQIEELFNRHFDSVPAYSALKKRLKVRMMQIFSSDIRNLKILSEYLYHARICSNHRNRIAYNYGLSSGWINQVVKNLARKLLRLAIENEKWIKKEEK